MTREFLEAPAARWSERDALIDGFDGCAQRNKWGAISAEGNVESLIHLVRESSLESNDLGYVGPVSQMRIGERSGAQPLPRRSTSSPKSSSMVSSEAHR